MEDLRTQGLICDEVWSPSDSRVNQISGQGRQTKVFNNGDPYFLYEHDPDLIVEVDIQLDRHDTNTKKKPRRVSSGLSSKSSNSSSPIKTRGRPKKPYEMEPFLSVDNIPPEKISEMVQHSRNLQKRSRSSTTAQGTRTQSSTRASGLSPYTSPAYRLRPYPDKTDNRKTPSPNKGVEGERTGLSTPGGFSGFQSPNKVPKKINHCVKHPFKHSVSVQPVTDTMSIERGTTPSSDMKERTALATFHVGKVLAKDNTERQRRLQGKLLKGNDFLLPEEAYYFLLQPLKPVVANGPSIKQCRGIVAETRTYGAPPNRTLARRRELIQTIPNIHEYLYERPQTVESIHRTSEASSVDENRDNVARDDFSDQELSDRLVDRMGTSVTEVTMPYAPPGSSATNYKPLDIPHGADSPRMLPTEINSKKEVNQTDLDEQTANTIKSKLNLLDNSNNNAAMQRQFTDDMVLSGHVTWPDSRPHTAGNVSMKSKSVRFVDESLLSGRDASQTCSAKSVELTSEKKDSNEKTKEKQGKESCKPSDLNQGKKRDDSDDDSSPRRPGSGQGESSKGQSDSSKSKNNVLKSITESDKSSDGDKRVSSADKNGKNGKQQNLKIENENEIKYSIIYYRDSSHLTDLESKKDTIEGTHEKVVINKQSSDTVDKKTLSPNKQYTNKKKRGKLSTSETSGRKGNVMLTSVSHEVKDNLSNRCARYKDNTKPAALHVQNIMHSGQIHSVVCPESPSIRSRSPSPSRRQRPESPFRKSINYKQIDKNNKLIRPSSANKAGRQLRQESQIRLSKTGTTDSMSKHSTSESCDLAAGESCNQSNILSPSRKVYFEADDPAQPERQSIFVETVEGDEVVVSVKQDLEITFADIEAEIMALREDIQEKIQNETLQDQWSRESESSDVEQLDLEDVQESPVVRQQDTWREYEGLLDIYRKKCMEASETCGEISETLTTPRILRRVAIATKMESSKDQEESKLKQRNSVHSELTVGSDNVESSGIYTLEGDQTSIVGLTRSVSEITVSDSAVSGLETEFKGETSTLGDGQQQVNQKDCFVPPLNLETVTSESEDKDKNEDQVLLEMVCDELNKSEYIDRTSKSEKLPLEDLEIVAQPKTLTKHKQKKDLPKKPVAPFAPLCFEINARPPKGYLYYFAYGTDMNISRLTAYIRREPVRFWGLLFGFQLVFNKRGCDTAAGGFANIEFNPYCSVEGCMYPITPQELELLDKHMGYPQHYEHLVLPVWMMNSKDSPDQYGVAQYCVPALTYIAQDKWICKDEKLDCDYSLSQCVKSSGMVTPAYRGHMVNLATPSCATVSA